MDEILKFLVIMGIIAFAIYRQAAKARKAAEEAQARTPSYDPEAYEDWDDEEDRMQTLYPETSIPSAHAPRSAYRATPPPHPKKTQKISPPPVVTETEQENEYHINSAEEARKAIVWSEILNRKYT